MNKFKKDKSRLPLVPSFKVWIEFQFQFHFTLIVFCCIVAWIQPDNSGCQQARFSVVWKWIQLRIFWGVCEDNFRDTIREVNWESFWNYIFTFMRLSSVNIAKCSKQFHLRQAKSRTVWQIQSILYYATWFFVVYQNEIRIWKILYCCPALEPFSGLPCLLVVYS